MRRPFPHLRPRAALDRFQKKNGHAIFVLDVVDGKNGAVVQVVPRGP
jgi:hypothetical protein